MNPEKLKGREYYLAIDKSGSMAERDCAGGKSRWDALQESTLAVANFLNEYDPDGITVIPFASHHKVYANTTPAKVKDVFSENAPMGGTNLAPVLNAMFTEYLSQKKKGETKPNGSFAVIVTDGEASDESDVVREIVNFTKKIDNREEFGVLFVQVGRDAHAKAYLQRLDSDLAKEGAKLDIVAVKTMDDLENSTLTDALIAGLTE